MTEDGPRGEGKSKAGARERGVVKWFDPEIGYGFIDRQEGEDVFVHIADVQRSGIDRLYEGQQVEFDVKETQKGLQAEGLSFIETEAAAPIVQAELTEITLAEVYYASALGLFERERLDPAAVEAWKGITLADKDPGFRVDLEVVGPYEGETPNEFFARQIDIIDGLATLAGLSLVRAAVTARLRQARGLPVPEDVQELADQVEEEPPEAAPAEGAADDEPPEDEPGDDEAIDEETSEDEPADDEPQEDAPADEEAPEDEPGDDEPIDEETPGDESGDDGSA